MQTTLTHNPQFYQWSKHITLHHHWLWDLVTDKMLDICHDLEQTAHILTKELLRPKFMQPRAEMGIQSIQ